MQYLFEQAGLTCAAIETELGLERGDIVSLTVYPEGAVEVETRIDLTVAQQNVLKTALSIRNLPRGKRPAKVSSE